MKLVLELLKARIESRIGRRNLKLVSLSFIILSLFLPAFWGSSMRGIQAMCFGWICFYTKDFIPALVWLANPVLFASLFLSPKRRNSRLLLAFISMMLGVLAIFITRIPKEDYNHYVSVLPSYGYIAWIIGVTGIFIYHLERWKSKNA